MILKGELGQPMAIAALFTPGRITDVLLDDWLKDMGVKIT